MHGSDLEFFPCGSRTVVMWGNNALKIGPLPSKLSLISPVVTITTIATNITITAMIVIITGNAEK